MKSSNNKKIQLGGYDFHFICDIEPVQNSDGTVETVMPQSRYKNAGSLSLNRYGNGPFCRFRIPNKTKTAGVYAILAAGQVMYIGECKNLAARYNAGYGNISPRNCFVGGQETNCRINNLILTEFVNVGSNITLWFFETDDYKRIEAELLKQPKLPWNRK